MSDIIGIIGGNGVAATNKLQELIENELTLNGAIRDCDHPEIIVWHATKAPSRSMYLEEKGPSFIEDYIDIAQKLHHLGAKKICMCCNTAHYAIDIIEEKSGVEFINLIEQVAKRVKQLNIKTIGIAATNGSYRTKIYNKYLNKISPETEIIYPDEEFQELVTKGICNVKNIHRFDNITSKEHPQNIFSKVKQHLINKGAEKVIMGCTDIRVGYYDKDNIDSLEVLKDTIILETCSAVERD